MKIIWEIKTSPPSLPPTLASINYQAMLHGFKYMRRVLVPLNPKILYGMGILLKRISTMGTNT